MHFTDLFIRRPVLAVVVTAVVVVSGLRAALSLPVQQFPQITSDIIKISTSYYGADAATIAGFVTTPIEAAVSAAEGVDYISSTSQTGLSTITLNLRLNQSAQKVVGEVQAYVSSVSNRLPVGTQVSSISVSSNNPASLYVSVTSDMLRPEQVSDYVSRIVLPQIRAVPGVIRAANQSDFAFTLRVWFDADKLAGYGLSASDAASALSQNDYVTGIGTTQGGMTYANLAITSGLHTPEQFRNLVLMQRGSALIRLGDVARVEYGSEITTVHDTDRFGGGAFLYVQLSSSANMLTTTSALRNVLTHVQIGLPPGIRLTLLYDLSDFVHAALNEVEITLIESVAIVSIVIFLFLGTWRSVIIPLVTIPCSLIGTLALMGAFGFSINTLTLLALVLAIGLVVDDAIIVVESVSRHLADARTPAEASLLAGRELAGPIIAMTLVLVAAYVPVGLQTGLTGALFTEFAFTLAGSVTVSALLALTLSPMMASRMLHSHDLGESRLVKVSDQVQQQLHRVFEPILRLTLRIWPAVIGAAIIVIAGSIWMLQHTQSELAPIEDEGLLYFSGQAPPATGMDFAALYEGPVIAAFRNVPEARNSWVVEVPGGMAGGLALKPWNQRLRSARVISATLQAQLDKVAGVQIAAFQLPPLPGASGMPIQFVLKGGGTTQSLASAARRMLRRVVS